MPGQYATQTPPIRQLFSLRTPSKSLEVARPGVPSLISWGLVRGLAFGSDGTDIVALVLPGDEKILLLLFIVKIGISFASLDVLRLPLKSLW